MIITSMHSLISTLRLSHSGILNRKSKISEKTGSLCHINKAMHSLGDILILFQCHNEIYDRKKPLRDTKKCLQVKKTENLTARSTETLQGITAEISAIQSLFFLSLIYYVNLCFFL